MGGGSELVLKKGSGQWACFCGSYTGDAPGVRGRPLNVVSKDSNFGLLMEHECSWVFGLREITPCS